MPSHAPRGDVWKDHHEPATGSETLACQLKRRHRIREVFEHMAEHDGVVALIPKSLPRGGIGDASVDDPPARCAGPPRRKAPRSRCHRRTDRSDGARSGRTRSRSPERWGRGRSPPQRSGPQVPREARVSSSFHFVLHRSTRWAGVSLASVSSPALGGPGSTRWKADRTGLDAYPSSDRGPPKACLVARDDVRREEPEERVNGPGGGGKSGTNAPSTSRRSSTLPARVAYTGSPDSSISFRTRPHASARLVKSPAS